MAAEPLYQKLRPSNLLARKQNIFCDSSIDFCVMDRLESSGLTELRWSKLKPLSIIQSLRFLSFFAEIGRFFGNHILSETINTLRKHGHMAF